ncbi:hypothetical protein EMIHUDRAFT_209699 [Emiliania huxleyi CCMP1516]|uniref:U-box domain-containing protein n=2 Tax=Emiliania huxleyi TaxID=2903 RepID=A0A0D3J2L1_EMIH1|nr:hypothetical protein EMIHUDRAFT_209699 [Emiliania huxleyi CCMP1516]EOD17746.1 hypothetical protein EMIHUDRAFT_209699 [Emiliania huxleyi CCMP1516]|eukprot:XP_005770175.1 hypothetical protein EMIHUDRAFT_209699 [Emiliania huxleyi CCMP1516]
MNGKRALLDASASTPSLWLLLPAGLVRWSASKVKGYALWTSRSIIESAYERKQIERWLATKSTSPMTGEALEHIFLFPNQALRGRIRDWQEAH